MKICKCSLFINKTSPKSVQKKILYYRKRLKKCSETLDIKDVVTQTRRFNIYAVLDFSEIKKNSLMSYMINKETLKIGEHLNCVVLDDLCMTPEKVNIENLSIFGDI